MKRKRGGIEPNLSLVGLPSSCISCFHVFLLKWLQQSRITSTTGKRFAQLVEPGRTAHGHPSRCATHPANGYCPANPPTTSRATQPGGPPSRHDARRDRPRSRKAAGT